MSTWLDTRHDFTVNESSIFFKESVLSSISMVIHCLTKKNDFILMHTPIYHPFFLITRRMGRNDISSPLVYKNKSYSIDWLNFEEKVAKAKLFILCNPQNPGCRCWNLEELTTMVEICKKYNVPIISDEVHADLTMPGYKHIPLAKACPKYEKQIITLMAPTKTFNLAGIKASFYITTNIEFLRKFHTYTNEHSDFPLNTLGKIALNAAYSGSADWVDNLNDYIISNYNYVKSEVARHCPSIIVTNLEATYLMWLNCRALNVEEEALYEALLENKVDVQIGSDFGEEGIGFIRINIACPKKILKIGLSRIIAGIRAL
ncbi:aminotransferase class I/II-fold pyridoxal phosphate-dependent enzyme [Listeria grandensis]|nr:aminotransferase class I/II-fold pyridoxal phosphate-dependent enzyme [Listeria grandensis]MBC1474403.1 aminotransferase class I/II-fold pyridoxal phosphate-dependent enzyme [Listeria grandensis]